MDIIIIVSVYRTRRFIGEELILTIRFFRKFANIKIANINNYMDTPQSHCRNSKRKSDLEGSITESSIAAAVAYAL